MTENERNFRLHGTYHTACGRVLTGRKTAGLEDDAMDNIPKGIVPVRHVISGAQAYAHSKGLADPHAGIDYSRVTTNRDLLKDLAHHYDQLPMHDPRADRHFQAMRDEVNAQHHFLTHRMGVNVQVVDHDPYKDVHELRHDVEHNKQIKVLGTHATGGHPFFSNEENDRFRAVHDVFGHLGTGRDFDRHGEEAAFQAHARMFSHHALPALTSETRGQNGSLIVNGHFGPQRIAILPQRLWHPGLATHANRKESMNRIATIVSSPDMPSGFQVYAHVSGNSVNILHCFAGETRYITKDGVKTLAETAGTIQQVLTADRGSRDARWVETIIHEFPAQPLMKVTLRRNKINKVIYATPEHKWLVTRPERFVTTANLKPNHRLQWATSKEALTLQPNVEGIRHGVVFGDGYAHSNGKMAAVTLWGEKDNQLLKFFPCIDAKDRITPNGIAGVYLGGTKNSLHAAMKGIPSLDESPEYLLGWLAGYFAADGSVSEQGQAIICSSKLEHIEAVRDVAQSIGISTYSIVTKSRQGYGAEESPLFSIQFVGSTVPASMFLIEQHHNRFALRDYDFERIGWTVVSVEETDRFEPVYCPRVPGTESFVLEDNIHTGQCPFCGSGAVIGRSDGTIECGYCTSVFTVQIQPTYNGFPQSVDGQPYPWPGAPDPGDVLAPQAPAGTNLAPGDPEALDGPPESSDPNEGGDFGSEDSEDEDDSDKPDDDKKSDSKKNKNPFAKKKSYIALNGAELDADEFLRHLAIRTAADPKKTAQRVLEERKRKR